MARYSPIKNSFVAGELSPRLEGRDDLDQYFQGMRRAINGITLPHGGFMRRAGSRFVGETKYHHLQSHITSFEASTAEAYQCEFGDGYVRFWANEGQVLDGGFPLEISTPFIEAELEELQFVQENDVMWAGSTSHHPYKLSRTGVDAFTFTKVVWKNGHAPMRPANISTTTLTVASTSTSTTLTFSADVGLTDYDVGRAVRWASSSSVSTWYEITSVSSVSVAAATLMGGSTTSGSATTDWSLGMYSNSEGPRAIQLVQGRLGYFGSDTLPNWWQLSKSDDFDDFDLGLADDGDAIARRVSAGRKDAIQWAQSADERLIIGTTGTEFSVGGDADGLLTPAATTAVPSTARGSSHVQALNIDSEILFIQRNERKLRIWTYDLQKDGRIARDATILAEHLLLEGVAEMHYQQDPDSLLWLRRRDGILVAITYEREQKVNGAHRHILGGDYGMGNTIIESVAVIPSPDGEYDQVWMTTLRTIDGFDRRYVEFFMPAFRPNLDLDATAQERSVALESTPFSDCSLTLNEPLTIVDISRASPGVFTIHGHSLTDGDTIRLRTIEAAAPTEDEEDDGITNMTALNDMSYTVANATTDTFTLLDAEDDAVDTSEMTAYLGGGMAYLEVQSVTGLEHLEGQLVDIQADGAIVEPQYVTSGSISLETPASIIHVGLNYVSVGETMRFVGGSRIGTDQGRRQRIARVVARVFETLGAEFRQGPNDDTLLQAQAVHYDGDPMDRTPPVFTGDIDLTLRGGWNQEPTVYFEQRNPAPMTILALMPYAESRER